MSNLQNWPHVAQQMAFAFTFKPVLSVFVGGLQNTRDTTLLQVSPVMFSFCLGAVIIFQGIVCGGVVLDCIGMSSVQVNCFPSFVHNYLLTN